METTPRQYAKEHPLYLTWRAMIRRCALSQEGRSKYDGHIIEICDRWKKFKAFAEDIKERPEGKNFGRIDINGHFVPENVSWYTPQEQSSRRRNVHWVTAFGKTQTLKQWATEKNIAQASLRRRIKNGWPSEIAMGSYPERRKYYLETNQKNGTLPRELTEEQGEILMRWHNARPITAHGKTQGINAWARETGLCRDVIARRAARGWPDEMCVADAKKSREWRYKGSPGRKQGVEGYPACITHDGRTQTINRWAEEFGMSGNALRRRLKNGMPVEQALTARPHKRNRWHIKQKGEPVEQLQQP